MLDPADALAIICGTSSENTVLVGGQAVMLWAAYFGIHPSRASLTADVDYLAKTVEAKPTRTARQRHGQRACRGGVSGAYQTSSAPNVRLTLTDLAGLLQQWH